MKATAGAIREDLIRQVERVRELLTAVAGGNSTDLRGERDYGEFRKRLMTDSVVAPRLPGFVKRCRTLGDFWTFIKPRIQTYQKRREFLLDQFDPLLTYLEAQEAVPSTEPVLGKLDSEHVQIALHRVATRVASDPESAMTAARTLIETVCKHILDDAGIKYDDKAELPKLYRQVAESLNLAPDQHTEGVFKQVLGGCTAVVEGLGSLRSRLGDAHGKSRKAARPAARHATLVVNLASAMCVFLVETRDARNAPSK
jgi:hypothetical protein